MASAVDVAVFFLPFWVIQTTVDYLRCDNNQTCLGLLYLRPRVFCSTRRNFLKVAVYIDDQII